MEIEVADWLNVSRTPVRDAIRRLEAEGMLAHEPRNGLVVAKLDRQAVMELYVMREVLEGTAARLCARHASDMEVHELDELVKRERDLQNDYQGLARHNRLFHEAVHRGAHNRYLEKSLLAVTDSMGLLGRSQMLMPHRARTALAEHAELSKAIRERNPEAAEQAARRHVLAAQRERLKLLFPDAETST
jgi:DNA-binding GntR family transcriptional regulator